MGKKKQNDNTIRAIELKKNNPNITQGEIAKILDISIPAVSQIFSRHKLEWDTVQTWKSVRSDIMAGLQEKILSEIKPEDIEKASLKDKVLSASILYDKEQLENNKSKKTDLLSDIIERVAKVSRETTINVNIAENNQTLVVEQ